MAYLEYFPPQVTYLQEEINNHPALLQLLQTQHMQGVITETLDMVLHIAAYAGVEVDGMLNEKDILNLCEICTERLRKLRGETA